MPSQVLFQAWYVPSLRGTQEQDEAGKMRQVYSPSRSIVAPHRQQNCFFFLAGWITLCRHSSPGHTHCTRVMESVPPALRTAGIHARRVRSPGHSWKAKPRGAPPVGLQQRHLKIQTLLRKHFHDVPGTCPIPGHRIWQPKDTLPGAGTTPLSPAHPRLQALSWEKARRGASLPRHCSAALRNRLPHGAVRPRRLF